MKWSITIAILAVLIAGVVTSAIGQVPIGDLPYPTTYFPHPTMKDDGSGNCPFDGITCYEGDAFGYLEPPDSTTSPRCEDYIDYLRGHDAYLGENDDYIFLQSKCL